MKKLLLSTALLGVSSFAMADAPGGPNCGWGNLLMQGQSGLISHLVASSTNGTSGNATFGMTFGTNGCSVDGALTYGGDSMVWFDDVLDEYSTDVALGQGETLDAVAVMIGVEQQDREHFGKLMHDNFVQLFPATDVSSQEVLDSMIALMSADPMLSKYVG
ncbi:MAG: DUF3015 domain-containing protein [Granulosicoccus sp.]